MGLTPLIIWNMQMKATIKLLPHSHRDGYNFEKIKSIIKNKGEEKQFYIASENINWCSLYGKYYGVIIPLN